MQFLLLTYIDEAAWQALPQTERNERMAEFRPFAEALKNANALVGTYRPHPSAHAATVRTSDGQAVVGDGPFVKSREQLGGVYVIEVADRDQALSWAARLPASRFGVVEVRPLVAPAAGRP